MHLFLSHDDCDRLRQHIELDGMRAGLVDRSVEKVAEHEKKGNDFQTFCLFAFLCAWPIHISDPCKFHFKYILINSIKKLFMFETT